MDRSAPARIPLAAITATLAFWCYTQTLLPGVDLGDTGGFQAAVLWPEVSARQAYPLYYGLARPFVAFASPENPARGLNLFSAMWGAVAVGLLTYLSATVTRSLVSGAFAGLLLAFSYTFWSQAIIAEVYTLHLALMALCLLLLRWYASQPGFARLAAFFTVCALAFGNHLGTSLLLAPFALFLILSTPNRRDLFQPRVLLAALAIAAVGALQYLPNFLSVWRSLDGPSALSDAFAAFWFDTTKQDWRETMVMGVTADQTADRLAMWLFDARQQFGTLPLLLAPLGVAALWRLERPWALLAVTTYVVTAGFALSYNVGDPHVFFLPAHLVMAFAAGAALRFLPDRRLAVAAASLSLIAYTGWRGWSTWPVVDRHDDRRGERLVAQLAHGISDGNGILVTQMNWQLENVVLYTTRHLRRDLSWTRLGDVLTHWPLFVADNHRAGRDLILDGEAARAVASLSEPGRLLPDGPSMSLADLAATVPPGSPYVLTVLAGTRETPIDEAALEAAVSTLDGGTATRQGGPFEVVAGLAGQPPVVHRASRRPFTTTFALGQVELTVRLESWLPIDTFRRQGFGHLVRGRERLMILERGVNLVWLGRDGTPSQPYYAFSLFAPQPRFRLLAATLGYAKNGQNQGNPPARTRG